MQKHKKSNREYREKSSEFFIRKKDVYDGFEIPKEDKPEKKE